MLWKNHRYQALVLCGLLALLAAAALAAEEEQPARPGVLMELFTSQGCYSCPPADALLHANYVGQQDLIPLEFHVHYWDDLVYGFAGSWKDPFSSPTYTDRQRAYNLSIHGSGSMYTPQIVVQGRHETVGVRQTKIDAFIAEEKQRAQPLQFYFSGSAQNGWRVRVDGSMQGNEDFYYAVYIRERTTEVKAGENKGKSMINSHIVKDFQHQPSSRRRLSIPKHDAQSEDCAVWVQKPQTGAVVAAARCPQG